jgi:hypothetical protein
MIRKFINSSLMVIAVASLLGLVACGSESDMDYDRDWLEVEDEIEYRMDNVDLQPAEDVEIEYTE